MRRVGQEFIRGADIGCALVLFASLCLWSQEIAEFKPGHVITFAFVLWAVGALLARR